METINPTPTKTEYGSARFQLSSFSLHLIAMGCMLADHLWATVVTGHLWLGFVGRIAYPIFAFLLVEGFFHTSDRKRYALRLLLFALLSEIPFNLMYGGRVLYPYHQNVLFTFLIGFFSMQLNEWAKQRCRWPARILAAVGGCLFGFLLGFAAMTDFYGVGVLTILVFYFFRGRTLWHFAAQALLLLYLHVEVLGGMQYGVLLFGREIFLSKQGFALLSLLPIWLYRGKQGYHSKPFRLFCYAFYPLHMLLLVLIRQLLF